MIERIAVIGGDARQLWLAQALLRSGFRVRTYAVPGLEDGPGGLFSALDGAQAAALPMPALDVNGRIRTAGGEGVAWMWVRAIIAILLVVLAVILAVDSIRTIMKEAKENAAA